MFDERFARQYRYELPSEFPLTSPYAGIVHHLSGPIGHAHTRSTLRGRPMLLLWHRSLSFRVTVFPPSHSRVR